MTRNEHHELVLEVLSAIVLNARLQPDASMGGSTDCYAVPIDDIEWAREVLAEPVKS